MNQPSTPGDDDSGWKLHRKVDGHWHLHDAVLQQGVHRRQRRALQPPRHQHQEQLRGMPKKGLRTTLSFPLEVVSLSSQK